MRLLEKILLVVDFQESADYAVQMTSLLARTFGSEVILFHAIPQVHDAPLALDMVKSVADEQLEILRDGLERQGVRRSRTAIGFGAAPDKIVEAADQENVNVIVMGSGEHITFFKVRLGSITEQVIKRSAKPVWVVKKNMPPVIETILCPVDLSEVSKGALKNAIHLARGFKAELIILRVLPSVTDDDLVEGVRAAAKDSMVDDHLRKFDEFLEGLDLHGVNWHKELRGGKPHEKILALAEERLCDLVVMGTTGETHLSTMLLGSVTKKIAEGIPTSILLMKAEDPIRLQLESEFDHLESHCSLGRELLEKGFAEEAAGQFEHCIASNNMYAPAWDGLADAYQRVGDAAEAERARERARQIRDRFWERRVEAEVREHHPLTKKKKKR